MKSDPGPTTTRSASRSARAAGPYARAGSSAAKRTHAIGSTLSATLTCPTTRSPETFSAVRITSSSVEGRTRPRERSSSPAVASAFGNEPSISARAAMTRLPSACPARPSPCGKRYENTRARDEPGSADIATRQLRASPGGSIPSSRRRWPLDPPSSAIVTTAVVSNPMSSRLKSTLGSPVPPPTATARGASPLTLGPCRGGCRGDARSRRTRDREGTRRSSRRGRRCGACRRCSRERSTGDVCPRRGTPAAGR